LILNEERKERVEQNSKTTLVACYCKLALAGVAVAVAVALCRRVYNARIAFSSYSNVFNNINAWLSPFA